MASKYQEDWYDENRRDFIHEQARVLGAFWMQHGSLGLFRLSNSSIERKATRQYLAHAFSLITRVVETVDSYSSLAC